MGRRRGGGSRDRQAGDGVLAMQGLEDVDRSLHEGVLESSTAPD